MFLVISCNYYHDILEISGGILICSIHIKINKEIRHLQIDGPGLWIRALNHLLQHYLAPLMVGDEGAGKGMCSF